MRLITLHLANFRQHAATAVTFPATGITGIVGANGGGKSSILEGASWALYGTDAIRGVKAGIRSKRATSRRQAEADLKFAVGGREYRVLRRETDAKLWDCASGDVIAAGTAPVDEAITKLVGMGWTEFRATYLCQQRDLNRIASMGPLEREKFYREVMGIGRIDEALDACRKRKNSLTNELQGHTAGLGERAPLEKEDAESFAAQEIAIAHAGDANDALDDALGSAGDANDALEVSTQLKEQFDAAARAAADAERRVNEAAAEQERLRGQIANGHAARTQLAEREIQLQALPGLRQERDQLTAAKSATSERNTLQQAIAAATHDVSLYSGYVADCDRALQAHDAEALRQVEDAYRSKNTQLRDLVQARQQKLAEAQAEFRSAKSDVQRNRLRREALQQQGPDGACHTCEQVLGERFAVVLAQLDDDDGRALNAIAAAHSTMVDLADPPDEELALEVELEDLKTRGEQLRQTERDAKEAREKRDGWQRRLAAAQERINESRQKLAAVPQLPENPERLSAVNAEIAKLEQLDMELNELRQTVGRLSLLQEQLDGADARRADAAGDLHRAITARDALSFDAEHHAQLVAQAVSAAEALSAARTTAATASADLRAAEARRARAVEALRAYDDRALRLQTLAEQVTLHERAAERLDAFRRAEASTIRPELEELTTGFVSLLTDGRFDSVTIGEGFEVQLHEAGVAHDVVSGGTEDITSLALRLATSQMIAERAGHPLSLLILDEPFGSLDDVRRQNVLSLIRRLAGVFEQVLLISHVDETKHAVDHVIEVEYDEATGRSYVTSRLQPTTPVEEVAA